MSNAFTWLKATCRGGALVLTLLTLACGRDGADEGRTDAPQPTDSVASPGGAPQSGIVPSLTPATGAIGTQVTLTASGLPPGAAVEIGFGAPQENFEVLTEAVVDGQGSLWLVVSVPSWAQAGRGYHFSIARVNQPPLGLSTTFQVTAP